MTHSLSVRRYNSGGTLLLWRRSRSRPLGQQSCREALTFRQAFDLERDRIHRLHQRSEISVHTQPASRQRIFCGHASRAPGTKLSTYPRSNESHDSGYAAGYAEKENVVLAQRAVKNLRKHRSHCCW